MERQIIPGMSKSYSFTVKESDMAIFHGELLHAVCSTFTLGREIEWSTRLFVIDYKNEEEEGVGTMLTIYHKSPAKLGDIVQIEAEVESFEKNELICRYVAKVGDRVVAEGQTGQKILSKEKLAKIFN
ncbi:hypothetical protein QWY31_02560 [Cytophagales bacterium LB-30]|uniref:Fluoroacetyl-CoA-specific thioesterase-like domain-containing protein n=1 Tax=Shiella aurantiaca TaxID=3058365 RepID=A0ABT8F296_9BACT|nr:hotdog domain-containing protein [Shiella aurantiaca]MDN4164364.1 hypothetical protein [Shiella aurantiaca]